MSSYYFKNYSLLEDTKQLIIFKTVKEKESNIYSLSYTNCNSR